MNISRQCAHKWWRRYRDEGEAGLVDRSSRPHSCPHQTPARVERRIVALRQSRKLGPARLAGIVDVPASTVHRVLVRHGVNRLRWMDRPTGRVIRRIETSRCGELVHIDVKKLARVPDGGGHRKLGRAPRPATRAPGRRLHPHPHRDRRLLAARLQRVRRHREHRQLRRVPRPSRRLVRRHEASRSSGSSPTTATATAASPGATAAPSSASATPAPGPTTPPPTARSNGSTAPSPTNGPTPDSGNQNAAEPAPLTASSTATTITDTTPPSAAHPPAASPTWPGTTASRPRCPWPSRWHATRGS